MILRGEVMIFLEWNVWHVPLMPGKAGLARAMNRPVIFILYS